MGELFSFVCAFFRGWKRMAGCVTLYFASMGVSEVLQTISMAQEDRIQPREVVPWVIAEQSIIVLLFTFISAYLLISKPKSDRETPIPD